MSAAPEFGRESGGRLHAPAANDAVDIAMPPTQGGGAAWRLRVGLKTGLGAAARLEAGNCGEGFACLFQVQAVFSHQVCADGSIFPPSAVQGGADGIHIPYAAYFGPFPQP